MDEIESRPDEQTSEQPEPYLDGWYVASAEATPAPYDGDPSEPLSLYERILERLSRAPAAEPDR